MSNASRDWTLVVITTRFWGSTRYPGNSHNAPGRGMHTVSHCHRTQGKPVTPSGLTMRPPPPYDVACLPSTDHLGPAPIIKRPSERRPLWHASLFNPSPKEAQASWSPPSFANSLQQPHLLPPPASQPSTGPVGLSLPSTTAPLHGTRPSSSCSNRTLSPPNHLR